MTRTLSVSFEDEKYSSIELPEGSRLSETLNVHNSPILFGCRTGICGTCAIEVLEGEKALHSRTSDEAEYLTVFAEGRERCRLACQIRLNANIKIRKIRL